MNTDVRLRHYQETALKNVFITNKARSGLIILPCGAGKSMIAIELIQRIKKKSVIFCENCFLNTSQERRKRRKKMQFD